MPSRDAEDRTRVVHERPKRRLGPHRVPRIECGKCGTKHHIDATTLPEQGRCRECFGYLRRPTEAEQRQFADFLDWNTRHQEGSA